MQWQLRIARGEHLDLQPESHGAAVEVRLYAEDPRTFLPQAGRIEVLRLPASIRVDAGVAEGRRDRHRLRPDDREAGRERRHAGRGVRPPRRRARRDGGRRSDDQPPVPALARRTSGVARRSRHDRVPRRAPTPVSSFGHRARLRLARSVPAQPPRSRHRCHRRTSTLLRTRRDRQRSRARSWPRCPAP